MIDFLHKAPAASIAHPRTEHFAPLFVSLGASVDGLQEGRSVIDGFWYGLSKRSWQFNWIGCDTVLCACESSRPGGTARPMTRWGEPGHARAVHSR